MSVLLSCFSIAVEGFEDSLCAFEVVGVVDVDSLDGDGDWFGIGVDLFEGDDVGPAVVAHEGEAVGGDGGQTLPADVVAA